MTTRDLSDYGPVEPPSMERIVGLNVTLEPIADKRRFAELHEAFSSDAMEETFRYMAYGRLDSESAFDAFANRVYLDDDLFFYALVPSSSGQATGDQANRDKAGGVMALMRADRENGVIELGHVCLAPRLQRSVAASEAVFQLMRHVFDGLNYRRLEWKCDTRNERSRRAAERFGFTFEGVFRQHRVAAGENRDTAWFSLLDGEWPLVRASFEAWLDAENFDGDGHQKRTLVELRREIAGN